MPQVELNEKVFQAAQRRAADGGYSSVEEYIADVVVHDLSGEGADVEHVFTSERLAELERISAEIRAGGQAYSMAEVQEHFESKRKAWLADYPP